MKISFAWCLTITALVLTLVPSILIWAILCNVLYSSLDLLETTTVDSIIGLSAVIEQQLLDSARNVLLRRLAEGDREMAAQVTVPTDTTSMGLPPPPPSLSACSVPSAST